MYGQNPSKFVIKLLISALLSGILLFFKTVGREDSTISELRTPKVALKMEDGLGDPSTQNGLCGWVSQSIGKIFFLTTFKDFNLRKKIDNNQILGPT